MTNETAIPVTPLPPAPPRHSLSDYFVLILLSVCIAIGVPMTLMTCWQLIQRLRLSDWCKCRRYHTGHRTSGHRNPAARTASSSSNVTINRKKDLLKLQLNVADLMVLIFYAFSKVLWTLTYNWRGGEFLCKLVRFLSVLSFHMCSNAVACIGLDRMITLLRPSHGCGTRCASVFTKEYFMPFVSCGTAILCSLPQLWIWTVVDVLPNWPQCVTRWAVLSRSAAGLSKQEAAWAEVYNVFHLLTIFWIPCTIIAVSYIVIVVQVLMHLKEPPSGGLQRQDCRNEDNVAGRSLLESNIPQNGHHSVIRRVKFGQCGRIARFLCRQTLTILTVYILCWGPYNAFTLWIHFKPQHAAIYRSTIRFLQELIVLNSVINPFLYACDVYQEMVDDRRRQRRDSCVCCCFTCPCAEPDGSEAETGDDL